MTPTEVWWLIEANKKEKVYGVKYQMTESDAREILKDLRTHVRFANDR